MTGDLLGQPRVDRPAFDSSSQARTRSGRAGRINGLLAALLLVIAVRLIPWQGVFTSPSLIGVAFSGSDEWVHFHRARALAETGAIPRTDAAFAAPHGLVIHWPAGYDAGLGLLLRVAGARSLAFAPILGALATALAVALAARGRGISVPATIAAWAVIPASLAVTSLGAIDHHAFEPALFWLPPLLLRRMPILAGIILGAAFYITPSASLCAAAFLTAAFALSLSDDKPSPEAVEDAVLTAGLLALPACSEYAAFDAPSLLGVIMMTGVGLLAAAATAGPGERGTRVTTALVFLAAIAPAAVALLGSGAAYMTRADDWMTSVAEARPLLTSDPRTFFQAVAILSPGILALPLLARRSPPELLAPALLALLASLLQIRFSILLTIPAALALVELAAVLCRQRAGILLAASLFLPMVRPIAAMTEHSPGLPTPLFTLVNRLDRHLPPHAVLAARWDVSPYAVALARTRSIADGFHRNADGRRVFAQALLAPADSGTALLRGREVTAILLSDPEDGFLQSLAPRPPAPEEWRDSLAGRLWRGEARDWREVDREGDNRLYVHEPKIPLKPKGVPADN